MSICQSLPPSHLGEHGFLPRPFRHNGWSQHAWPPVIIWLCVSGRLSFLPKDSFYRLNDLRRMDQCGVTETWRTRIWQHRASFHKPCHFLAERLCDMNRDKCIAIVDTEHLFIAYCMTPQTMVAHRRRVLKISHDRNASLSGSNLHRWLIKEQYRRTYQYIFCVK